MWYAEIKKAYIKKAIDRCQRTVTYAVLPVCRTVSTEAMQVLLRELPWHLQSVERGIIYSIKKNKPFPPNKYISEDELQGASLNLKRTIIREKLGRIWCENWAQSEKGRITHSFIPDPRQIKNKDFYSPCLEELFLLTGHGSMNAYLFDKNLCNTPECDCGSSREDWRHILFECSYYDDLRNWNTFEVTPRNPSNFFNNGALYEKLKAFSIKAFERRKSRIVNNT